VPACEGFSFRHGGKYGGVPCSRLGSSVRCTRDSLYRSIFFWLQRHWSQDRSTRLHHHPCVNTQHPADLEPIEGGRYHHTHTHAPARVLLRILEPGSNPRWSQTGADWKKDSFLSRLHRVALVVKNEPDKRLQVLVIIIPLLSIHK
jgi:hypothetical protein